MDGRGSRGSNPFSSPLRRIGLKSGKVGAHLCNLCVELLRRSGTRRRGLLLRFRLSSLLRSLLSALLLALLLLLHLPLRLAFQFLLRGSSILFGSFRI